MAPAISPPGLPACPCPECTLHSWDSILTRQLAIASANLDTLDAFFARWRHVIEWRRPAAGTVAFPRLLTGEGIEGWCERLVQEAGVLLMPASVYGRGSEAWAQRGHFRLGFGRRSLPLCLQHLEAFLAARYGPPPGADSSGGGGAAPATATAPDAAAA